MNTPRPLPPALRFRPFAVGDALGLQVRRGRLRARDLESPFWGVRAPAGSTTTVDDAARAYLTRMPVDGFFSHLTAARLWRIPLPLTLASDTRLHVAVPASRRAPAARGIAGHRVNVEVQDLLDIGGLPVTGLERTVLDLAAVLDDEAWLGALDNILWRRRTEPATNESVSAAIERWSGRRGRSRVEALAQLGTSESDATTETAIRLRFLRAGLPPMLPNVDIFSRRGDFIARPDLQTLEYLMAFDYEGDHHRTDREQWRKDLRRVPRLQDEGWHHTRISAADLADSRELIARTIRVLRQRGWGG